MNCAPAAKRRGEGTTHYIGHDFYTEIMLASNSPLPLRLPPRLPLQQPQPQPLHLHLHLHLPLHLLLHPPAPAWA